MARQAIKPGREARKGRQMKTQTAIQNINSILREIAELGPDANYHFECVTDCILDREDAWTDNWFVDALKYWLADEKGVPDDLATKIENLKKI